MQLSSEVRGCPHILGCRRRRMISSIGMYPRAHLMGVGASSGTQVPPLSVCLSSV